ncbi:UNVERIFIED_CONTAM: hypothetical protein FKN15_034483 [Acipenser sinensis]
MQNNLMYNAGYGSVLKELGGVEIDAIFLDGKTLASGAAATVKGIANPIKLSKLIEKVLQQHVILMPTVTISWTAVMIPVIVVHEGAGWIPNERAEGSWSGVQEAGLAGYRILQRGALDAVEEAVVVMENNLMYNAGYGSVLKELGGVEIDAIFLDGKTLASGAAATVKGIANPIKLSKLIEKFKKFHKDIIAELERKTELDQKYMNAKELLNVNLPSWQDKCTDATKVPDTIMTMIKDIKTPGSTPVSGTPQPSPMVERYIMHNTEPPKPPPAPQIKAHPSPLAEIFNIPASPKAPAMTQRNNYNNGDYLPKSVSVATGVNKIKRPKMKTIFPHTAGNNSTLLSFDEGDIIILLLPEEKDGWLYGEHEQLKQWFPSSYCRPYTEEEQEQSNSMPVRSISIANLAEKEKGSMVLPAPDYFESSPTRTVNKNTSPEHTVSI